MLLASMSGWYCICTMGYGVILLKSIFCVSELFSSNQTVFGAVFFFWGGGV